MYSLHLAFLVYEELRLHTIEVKNIQQGYAIILVDDKWHATLTPWNYHGPRPLLKRHNVFRAAASLYREAGKLHVRIHGVAEVEQDEK